MTDRLAIAGITCGLALFGSTVAIAQEPYWPTSQEWAAVEPRALGWNSAALEETTAYAAAMRSTALVILHDGRIAAEHYWLRDDRKLYVVPSSKLVIVRLGGTTEPPTSIRFDREFWDRFKGAVP